MPIISKRLWKKTVITVFSQDLNGYLRTFVDYNVIDIISNIINICN